MQQAASLQRGIQVPLFTHTDLPSYFSWTIWQRFTPQRHTSSATWLVNSRFFYLAQFFDWVLSVPRFGKTSAWILRHTLFTLEEMVSIPHNLYAHLTPVEPCCLDPLLRHLSHDHHDPNMLLIIHALGSWFIFLGWKQIWAQGAHTSETQKVGCVMWTECQWYDALHAWCILLT